MGRLEGRITQVVVEKGAAEGHMGRRILSRIPNSIPMTADAKRSDSDKTDPLGKGTLNLLTYKGEFFKPCPGTMNYICCGYRILNVGTNCPMDCSYCILQAYFNNPNICIFSNLEEQLPTVLHQIDSAPGRIHRVGTGEFTDSLALDGLTGWAEMLIPPFSARNNVVLEFKTKTDNIGGILRASERDRIVVSWSLNSGFVSTKEEHGAPSVRKRLDAARRCQREGFVVGFHFDPLVNHQGWRDDYRRTVDLIDTMIDPARVIWISMGALRFMPALKQIIRNRHPETRILDGEFVRGLDGKMRYFKPIRIEMYKAVSGMLLDWHRDPGLYLCMESDEVWKESLDWSPGSSRGLSSFLDSRVIRFFGW